MLIWSHLSRLSLSLVRVPLTVLHAFTETSLLSVLTARKLNFLSTAPALKNNKISCALLTQALTV